MEYALVLPGYKRWFRKFPLLLLLGFYVFSVLLTLFMQLALKGVLCLRLTVFLLTILTLVFIILALMDRLYAEVLRRTIYSRSRIIVHHDRIECRFFLFKKSWRRAACRGSGDCFLKQKASAG